MNKEDQRAYNRQYYLAHRGDRLAYNYKYRQAHGEDLRVKARQHYRAHRDELRVKAREYYRSHREEVLAHRRRQYQAHRDEKLARQRRYREAHRGERKWRAKFGVGDRVRFNGRVPKRVLATMRRRSRTITRCKHTPRGDMYYELGGRGKECQGYLFRSYMLIPAATGLKRSYGGRKSRYTFLLDSQDGRSAAPAPQPDSQ